MKITFITGAANGLGTEFARLYAQDNNNLLLVDKDEQGLLAVQQELQQKHPELVVDTFVADLSQTEELKRAYRYTVEKDYFVNNVVNGAGFGDRCDFKDMDIDKQLAMTNVNCNAVLYFTRVFLDNMLAHDEGHIINVASIAAFMPAPYMCTYHATKSFVLLLGEAISYEIRKTKVKLLTNWLQKILGWKKFSNHWWWQPIDNFCNTLCSTQTYNEHFRQKYEKRGLIL